MKVFLIFVLFTVCNGLLSAAARGLRKVTGRENADDLAKDKQAIATVMDGLKKKIDDMKECNGKTLEADAKAKWDEIYQQMTTLMDPTNTRMKEDGGDLDLAKSRAYCNPKPKQGYEAACNTCCTNEGKLSPGKQCFDIVYDSKKKLFEEQNKLKPIEDKAKVLGGGASNNKPAEPGTQQDQPASPPQQDQPPPPTEQSSETFVSTTLQLEGKDYAKLAFFGILGVSIYTVYRNTNKKGEETAEYLMLDGEL